MSGSAEHRWKIGHGRGEDTRFWFYKGKRQAKRVADGTARRVGQGDAPEVMVRFTSPARSGIALRKTLEYITREGSLPGEMNGGRIADGPEAVRRVSQDWLLANQINSVSRRAENNEAQTLVLSMPAGTPRDPLLDAGRAWAEKNLAGYDWMMVMHEDRDHPHLHIAIRSVGNERRRFSASPQQQRRWREDFARQLNERGIAAVATQARERQPTKEIEEDVGRTR